MVIGGISTGNYRSHSSILRATRPLCVTTCLLLLSLSYLYAHSSRAAVNLREPSFICAHRASVGGGRTPRSSNEIHAALTSLASAGIMCYDVDVTQLSDGTVVVGHPNDSSRVSLPDFFAALPAGATATMELKDALRGDVDFVRVLKSHALAARVMGRIAVDGLPATAASKGFRRFVALRDRARAPGGARCGHGDSVSAPDALIEVAREIAGADIVMPSVVCLSDSAVKEALKAWFSKKSTFEARGSIQTWVVDDDVAARGLLLTHARDFPGLYIVSNEPLILERALSAS